MRVTLCKITENLCKAIWKKAKTANIATMLIAAGADVNAKDKVAQVNA